MISFCHGANKIGSIASIKYRRVLVHHVPILFCPVCESVEPHPKIQENLDLVITIAHHDGLSEVDFNHYIHLLNYDKIFEDISTVSNGNWDKVIQSQIDIALDLLSVAAFLKDKKWEEDLKNRLIELSKKKDAAKA